MSKLKDIQINQFQLHRLLNEEEQKGYAHLLNKGVYCPQCKGRCAAGAEVTEIHLNDMNDILIRGTCKACGSRVARIMEFGEDKVFYKKANEFRKSM